MKNYLGRMIILVDDYEKAAGFYEKNFGFKRIFDAATNGQRYLHVGTEAPDSMGIWFLKAASPDESRSIGKQTAGHPTMVIYTNSLSELYQRVQLNGVRITVEQVLTPEYAFFHCQDPYGNEIVVTELK